MKFLLVPLFLLVSAAWASTHENVVQAVGDCKKIFTDSERLKCFDNINNIQSKAEPLAENWDISESISQLDRTLSVSAFVLSSEAKLGRNSQGERIVASLIIRCREKKTEMFISFPTIVASLTRKARVSFRIGDTAPRNADWDPSQYGKAFGPWNNKSTIPMLREIANASDFFVRSTAEYVGTSEALFKLDGAKAAIGKVATACEWKL